MKPEMRTAGIFASGTFTGIAAYSYWGTQDPVFASIYAALAAGAMGFVGYHIGKICAHPKGHLKPRLGKGKEGSVHKPMSGDENLMEDLPVQ